MLDLAEKEVAQSELDAIVAGSGMKIMFACVDNPSAVDSSQLQKAMQLLDEFAAGASFDTSPRMARLSSARLARQITRTALESFMDMYQQFYSIVERDDRLNVVAIRPPAQLKTLFGFE